MVSLFMVVALISGFFGIILLIAPKLYSKIAQSLSKTIATLEDTSKIRVPMGIVLLIVSILMFYIIHLHKHLGL